MRVVLAPVGTRGDVQPFLALGLALRDRGHQVTLCAPVNFAGWVESFGLRFVSIGTDFQANLRSYRDGGTRVVLGVARELALQVRGLLEACQGADALVGATLQMAGGSVAELLRIPYSYAFFWPQLIPSTLHSMLGMRWQTPPRWVNALTGSAGADHAAHSDRPVVLRRGGRFTG